MPRLCVVYNICELRTQGANLGFYKISLNSILAQNFDSLSVVVSGCGVTDGTKTDLQQCFGDRIHYCWIQDIHTVNITFNHSARQCEQRFGPFDAFLYVDSGVDLEVSREVLSCMYNLLERENCAMVAAQIEADNGYGLWNIQIDGKNPYLIKVGQTCNLHCQLFIRQLYEAYGGKIIPDIFRHFTTESVFSFLCAAIKKKFMICCDHVVHHRHGMDGPSIAFGGGGGPLELPYCSRSTLETCRMGHEYGLGYELCQQWLPHNPAKFDENGYALDDRLMPFIRDNLFLQPDQLDYDTIKYDFI